MTPGLASRPESPATRPRGRVGPATGAHVESSIRGDKKMLKRLLVVAAGMPFGTAGSTNLLRIAQIPH